MPDNPTQRTEPAVTPTPEQNVAPVPAAPVVEPEVEEVEEVVDPRVQLEETFSNPATVQAILEFLAEEKLGIDDVTIEEGYSGWHEGSDMARIKFGHGGRGMEFVISPDNDATEALAFAIVRQDLEQEPEIFSQDWLSSYIDEDRLRKALWSDVYDMVQESPDSYSLSPAEVEEEYDEENNVTNQEEIDAAAEAGISDEQIEEKVEEILRDPIQYLAEIYGDDQAAKEAMRIVGFDADDAAEGAIAADGSAHFLARYDGNISTLPSGGEYWREN